MRANTVPGGPTVGDGVIPQQLIQPAKQLARHIPFSIVETLAFPRESQWIRFGIKRPGAPTPSVALFTLHKVASTFTNDLLGYLNDEQLKLRRMDWDKYIYNKVPRNSSAYIADRVSDLFEPSGYCYGVFREALPIENLDQYRVLLILRDPRDILTSYYFSEAHSHAPPLNKKRLAEFEARRVEVMSMSIDEYVLSHAQHLKDKLDAYMAMSKTAGIEPLTYEQMMSDWDGFLDRIGSILDTEINAHDRAELRSRGQIGVEHSGDVMNHRRRGTPGDHRDKLLPQTVAKLTQTFQLHLDWLGIDAGAPIEIDLRAAQESIQHNTAA